MKRIKYILSIVLVSFLFTSCMQEQDDEKGNEKKQQSIDEIEDYMFEARIKSDSSYTHPPSLIYLGRIKSQTRAFISKAGFSIEEKALSFYFELNYKTNIGMNLLKRDEGSIVYSDLINSFPIGSYSLTVLTNADTNFNYLGQYPRRQEWNVSRELILKCETNLGYIDADVSTLSFIKNHETIFTFTFMGWISMIKYDIDKNNIDDVIIINNNGLEKKSNFYLLLL
jgi:hypothetical protein